MGMTNEEIESCIQTLRFLENTFLDDHGIFLNDKHPDNIEKIITFLHESSKPKTGHWIKTGNYFTGAYECLDYFECSCCHEESLEEGDYCPNCGAYMTESEDKK